MKRNSALTPAQKAAMEAESDKNKIKLETKYKSNNAGWGRLFSYYKPSWIIWVMVLLAFINSCAMPIIAYMVIKLQFAYYAHDTDPDWEKDTRDHLIFMACWIFVIFLFNAIEKSIFTIMGERLTF